MPIPRHIERARKTITLTFNATATIMRKHTVPDNTGGTTDTYTSAGQFNCQYYRQGTTPRERENAVQVQVTVLWIFVFEYGTQLYSTDQILVDGRAFEVVSGATGSGDVAARVLAMEIT